MTLYVAGDLFSGDLLRGPERPQPGEITATDDLVPAIQAQDVTILPLDNDSAADGSPLFLVAAGPPEDDLGAVVSVTTTGFVYRPPAAPFVGQVTIPYTVGSSAGATANGNVIVNVTAATGGGTPSFTNGWGPGPKSGFSYWLGCRWPDTSYQSWNAGKATDGSFMAGNHPRLTQAYQMNRNHDILDVWSNYLQMAGTVEQQWDWIAGDSQWNAATRDGSKTRDTYHHYGGQMSNNWPAMWEPRNGLSPLQQPMKCNIALVPKALSTKANPLGDNWKIWFDFAAGKYMIHFKRLGGRMGFRDISTTGLETGWAGQPSASGSGHYAPGRVTPRAARFIVLGWEINDSQYWSYFNHTAPVNYTPVSGGPTFQAGAFAKNAFHDGLANIVTAIKQGYLLGSAAAGNQKNCPYYFGTRSTARRMGGSGLRETLGQMTESQASLLQFVGQSAHNTEQACRDADATSPENPNNVRATWYSGGNNENGGIESPYVTANQEGLNAIGELCNKWTNTQWQVLLDETGQHFGGPARLQNGEVDPNGATKIPNNSNRRADLWWASLHDWFMKPGNVALRGGLHFYQGSSTPDAPAGSSPVSLSDTSLVKSPARGWPGIVEPNGPPAGLTGGGNAWWQNAHQWWYRTYQNTFWGAGNPDNGTVKRPRP